MNWFAATSATTTRGAQYALGSHPSQPVWLVTHKAVNARTTLQITVLTGPTSMACPPVHSIAGLRRAWTRGRLGNSRPGSSSQPAECCFHQAHAERLRRAVLFREHSLLQCEKLSRSRSWSSPEFSCRHASARTRRLRSCLVRRPYGRRAHFRSSHEVLGCRMCGVGTIPAAVRARRGRIHNRKPSRHCSSSSGTRLPPAQYAMDSNAS